MPALLRPSRYPVAGSIQVQTAGFAAKASDAKPEIVAVPSMGDSISEGTVVEFQHQVGDLVQADETVVVLETDKVSVDVNAPMAGEIQEFFTELEANVEVGKPLFSLVPKEVQASSKKQSSETPSQTPDNAQASKSTASTSNSSKKERVPMIKFLGKRSLLPKDFFDQPSTQAASREEAPIPPPKTSTSSPDVKLFHEVPATFGKLPLSKTEMESINSGYAQL